MTLFFSSYGFILLYFLSIFTIIARNSGDSDLQSDNKNACTIPLFGRSDGVDAECGIGERMEERVGYGRSIGSCGFWGWNRCREDLDLAMVPLHQGPSRRMRVAFTCNVCGQRTTRAINPHAYTDGTVFVQCCGCKVFHKLVDNLNLFHEKKCYVNLSFNYRDSNWNIDSKQELDHGGEFPME